MAQHPASALPHDPLANTWESPSSPGRFGAHASGVSWAAVFAGATASAALSLILLVLGTGLGLSAVSPWAQAGIGATALGLSTILWVTFTQVLASGLGGYLAGRLRIRWTAVATDEVFFRDTAHGLLSWAVATLATATLLASVVGAILGSGLQAGATVASGTATGALAVAAQSQDGEGQGEAADPAMGYLVDSLFRSPTPQAGNAAAPTTRNVSSPAEVARILTQAVRNGALPAEDARYLAQQVSQRTGISQPDAERRVLDGFSRLQSQLREAEARAKEAADKARKATAYASLWLFISLLGGAFVASVAATLGGRQRDL